ncbi:MULTISPECIES: hypothetical protein [unclassified Paenibacillus]|jgi:hypothetical protein|uniref:hypothetical protein n=1 Tax=unclassified Paenibacillus TaxID=185978 RepID=UPI0030FB3ECF
MVAVAVVVAVDPANDHTSAVSDSGVQRMIILRRIGLSRPYKQENPPFGVLSDRIAPNGGKTTV